MKIRRINRGIVLACVLAVGTASYVIYDQNQFSKGKESIRSTVVSYLEDTAEAQLIKDQQSALDAYGDVLDKYWVRDNGWFNEFDAVYDKKQITENWDTILSTYDPIGYTEKCEVKIGNIEVSKYGNSGAVASVEYGVYSEYYGMPFDFCGGDVSIETTENYYEDFEAKDIENIKSKCYKDYFSAEFYLEKVDDNWRIVGLSNFGYNYEVQEIENSKADNSLTETGEKAGEQNG